MQSPTLELKPDRERSLLRRHPWIFSGAIGRILGLPGVGETVAVCAADGAFLAWAAYSPASQIRARVWSFDEGSPPGARAHSKQRSPRHWTLRRGRFPDATGDAMRLIHGGVGWASRD